MNASCPSAPESPSGRVGVGASGSIVTSGKMPAPTASSSNQSTSAIVAGFQNMDERLPPAEMPANAVPSP
jgi:hypothetical protein